MGLYHVVKPCVVGKLHYVRPTAQPIEVDDGVAAPLVESGCLEPYPRGDQRVADVREGGAEVKTAKPARRPRSRRHISEG